jgi:hypothetical protein
MQQDGRFTTYKDHQSKIICPAKVSFKSEGEIKTFPEAREL